jgi:hypothetical protein
MFSWRIESSWMEERCGDCWPRLSQGGRCTILRELYSRFLMHVSMNISQLVEKIRAIHNIQDFDLSRADIFIHHSFPAGITILRVKNPFKKFRIRSWKPVNSSQRFKSIVGPAFILRVMVLMAIMTMQISKGFP